MTDTHGDKERASVSPQEPDLLVPWREIEETCKRIMKESDGLTDDSADYRLGQWMGADKVLFALDCVAERMRPSARSAGTRTLEITEVVGADGKGVAAPCAISGCALAHGKATLQSASERIVWPKEKSVGRMGEMAPCGDMTLLVALQDDGDVVVEVHQTRHSQYQYAQTEFCTPGPGGGRSPRTREALIALMVAIEADNTASPDRAWPPKDRATNSPSDSRSHK